MSMKRKRYAEPQIVFARQQAEAGTPGAESWWGASLPTKMGVAEAIFHRWKKRCAGLGVSEIRRLRQLEDENRWLRQLVADLTLDKAMPQDVPRKQD
jgi:putative transposase